MRVELVLLVLTGSGLAFCVRKTVQQLQHNGVVVAVWGLMTLMMAVVALWGHWLVSE